jgi:glycosyltransferase EpsD
MTAGIPSIVSDLPGVRTLVQDGVTGYVMPVGNSRYLADRLESFIKQPGLLASMKLAAKARAAQFSRSELSKRLMNIYQRVTVKSL